MAQGCVKRIQSLADRVLQGGGLDREEARFLLTLEDAHLEDLLLQAARIREAFKGRRIDLCTVTNAKSGACSEDCNFCAQSSHFSTKVPVYPLRSVETLVEGARDAKRRGATKYCIATSGRGIDSDEDLFHICEAIYRIKHEVGLGTCATLGALTESQMRALQAAGLDRFHHNLETSEAYFPSICTTHTFQDRVERVRLARRVGLSTCCGGIFGMGESLEDRIDLAFTIRDLGVDSVPINFLMPIPGTPLEDATPPSPLECLKIIALFRFLMPDREIRVCGGRLPALRQWHPRIFDGGASGMMIGNYLTTLGRPPEEDLAMLAQLGLEPRKVDDPP